MKALFYLLFGFLIVALTALIVWPPKVEYTAEAKIGNTVEISEPESSTSTPWESLLKEDKELYAMADCESDFTPTAIGHGDAAITGYPSYGLFQYQPKTFLWLVRRYDLLPGIADKDVMSKKYYFDPYLQIVLTKNALADGLGRHWKTCYYDKFGSGAHRVTHVNNN